MCGDQPHVRALDFNIWDCDCDVPTHFVPMPQAHWHVCRRVVVKYQYVRGAVFPVLYNFLIPPAALRNLKRFRLTNNPIPNAIACCTCSAFSLSCCSDSFGWWGSAFWPAVFRCVAGRCLCSTVCNPFLCYFYFCLVCFFWMCFRICLPSFHFPYHTTHTTQ